MLKSSRWLGCAAVMCLTVAQLSGCSSGPLVSGFRMPGLKSRGKATVAEKDKKLSAEEAEDILAQARDYEKQGDFPNAARLYRQYLNGGGAPLRPDAPPNPRDIAKSATTAPQKSRITDSLDEERETTTTRSATHKATTPPIRTATKSEERKPEVRPETRPEPKLAKKPSPPADDPWANSVDRSGEMPVIRPRNSSVAKQDDPKAVDAKLAPVKPAKPSKTRDAGIPDWAQLDNEVADRGTTRQPVEEEAEEPELDWKEPLIEEADAEDDLQVVDSALDNEPVAPEPEFEEETELAKAEETTWEPHDEEDSAIMDEPEAEEADQLAAPVLADEEELVQESIALLCKDCEPWVYAQAVKMESEDPETRKEGLTSLADMGREAHQASPAVRTMLDDADPLVQAHAAWALWEIESEPEETIPTLTELLDHPNSEVVQLACYMLGDIGPQAETSRHSLELLRDHADGSTRIHAAESLIRIGGVDKASLAVLTAAMKSKDSEIRWIAAVALGHCRGDGSRDAVKVLVSALKDIDPEVRSAAALSLGGLGTEAATAKADLERIARNDDPQVRDAAVAALACLK